MYFASRVQAGRLLASKVREKYRYEECVVMALGDGGVLVGTQIAIRMDSPLTLLASAEINLPREPVAIGGITAGGTMTYNHTYSQGELDEMVGEYHGFIESEKLTQMHNINHLIGAGGTKSRKDLTDKNIIIVSDGLRTGFEVDLAVQFLKPIAIKKVIVCTPFASIQAVDKMHVLADDLYCLSVISDMLDTNHYYDTNDIPSHETILQILEQVV